jgi:hypothetical protein
MISAVKPDEPASKFQQRDNAIFKDAGCERPTLLTSKTRQRDNASHRLAFDLEASLSQVVLEIQPSEIFGVHPAGHARGKGGVAMGYNVNRVRTSLGC